MNIVRHHPTPAPSAPDLIARLRQLAGPEVARAIQAELGGASYYVASPKDEPAPPPSQAALALRYVSAREDRLINLLRRADNAHQARVHDDWDGPHTDLLMLALAHLLDGRSLGYARRVLHDTADMLACTTTFSLGSAGFAKEAQAREARAAEAGKRHRHAP